MTVYKFQDVKRTAKKRVPCEGCGKKLNRQTTFMQTINPFNKNAEGYPKTYREIWDELGAKCREWEADTEGFLCTPCEEKVTAA